VFLRPLVVRAAARSDELSLDHYDLMRGMQGAAQPKSSLVVPVNAGPVLPPIVTPASPAQSQQPAVPSPVPSPTPLR